jgi:tetratricopeptide (TPR) repeat protein
MRGKQDVRTLVHAHNMAACLIQLDKLSEAEQLQRELIAMSIDVNGRDSRQTLALESSLSMNLMTQNKFTEAESIARSAFSMSQHVLEQEHPLTLQLQRRLALILRKQGRVQDSAPLLREALKISERNLGYDHEDTLAVRSKLAQSLFCDPGGVTEATATYRELSTYYEHPRHRTCSSALQTLENLAILLYEQDQMDCLDIQVELASRFIGKYGEESEDFVHCLFQYNIWREKFQERGVDLGKHSLPTEADKKAWEEYQPKISESGDILNPFPGSVPLKFK